VTTTGTSALHVPTEQTRFACVQSRQAPPREPQAVDALPLSHWPDAEQQPLHVCALHGRGDPPHAANARKPITRPARTMVLLLGTEDTGCLAERARNRLSRGKSPAWSFETAGLAKFSADGDVGWWPCSFVVQVRRREVSCWCR
jgi:hypothetical protein